MSSKVAFIGGCADATFKPVKSTVEQIEAIPDYFGKGALIRYFSHLDKNECIGWLQQDCSADDRFVLVGHSWGGDTAYLVARDCKPTKLNLIITIDPVSLWTFSITKPENVQRWINVWVKGFQDYTDGIAVTGGHWGEMKTAENHMRSDVSHAMFADMLSPFLSDIKRVFSN